MKWIDLPPVWLALALVMTWWIAQLQPMWLAFGHPALDLAGGLLVGGGLVLMLLAFVEMRKQRTTVIPHMEADHLVTTGIFRRSRNPIYLGDVLVLAGLALRWDATVALVLVPLFIGTITQRFIIPEENRLRRKFRADFARYCQKTRRWL
ncbi:methyltransferase family protein [Yoonia sediminilitoris]|uniref:Protein-S-isoprenylcysteine O-methyltransferase Ste14 n=1 Tax=Yoonia sediminilitoris TaxID=1286148 RepID=A0A2T6KR43_9RHOB|nr:isoprenylcysteine carboxylmethyltransferase family protein [Yoonia sediminilitoris]PUB19026.1 protein-S-isoprenylcysteine O-methyltransferase Ste14 [Yoonia sediminilitoris]RCW99194.1 protein-S-isoprenylcysteine O-methyltransferase Ste14 [Yoonia sediminilitoris]